ncbi:hypothetical protein [Winogradskyella psychrotolerans]|uniref:hypothetical protein n=1 Tax=Winogradskyella psychrotolerans TaxID=1344585 RepID=UPI001C0736DC|nr:hypothetical protein [Winogradskyella psychrotolerans]MBU2930146.1 hypothetical protein [Winogradskyella psychrotolerans]
MKNLITLVIALLISISSYAQQGINYKSLIKDNLGNVLSSQSISVQFQVREATANGTAVYTETHTETTDANGILILNIGTGTTSDIFTHINWSSNEHWLNVQIDITGGTNYTDMSTTQIMAVPYALNAKTAENIFSGNYNDLSNKPNFGLARTSSDPYYGWQLVGESYTKGDIGHKALDLSASSVGSNNGAIGYWSVALGYGTRAIGQYSTVIGKFSLDEGSPNSFHSNTSPLFIIGNGTADDNRSNALTVYGNGDTNFEGTLDVKNSLNVTNDVVVAGTLNVAEEINREATGNANLVPIAYGIVESTGNILSGTGNFTAFVSGNVFVIDVNGTESLSYGNTVCSITPISTSPRTASTVITDGNGDNDADLNVRIFNSSGAQVTTTFQFVIYKL